MLNGAQLPMPPMMKKYATHSNRTWNSQRCSYQNGTIKSKQYEAKMRAKYSVTFIVDGEYFNEQ